MTRPVVSAAVIDFDGTIVAHDVSEQLLEAFAPPEWWDIDLEFQRGEIGSRECLIRQGALLMEREADLLTFALENHEVDPTFAPFVAWARSAGIQVAVASDGFGFYVEPMLDAAGVGDVAIFRNEARFDGGTPTFDFPFAHQTCVGCGVCKMTIVQTYRRDIGPVAFVGEGHTDRYGALYADLVFAKKHLVEICRADGVPFLEWEDFDDVQAALATLDRLPGPVAPPRCPGWTDP